MSDVDVTKGRATDAREAPREHATRARRCDEAGASERSVPSGERLLRAVLERCAGGVALLDLRGRLLAANRTALECTGLDPGDAADTPIFDAERWTCGAEARDRLRNAVRRAATGESARFEAECPGTRGAVRTLDFSLDPVRDEERRISFLVLELRDATALVRARRAEIGALRGLAAAGESAAHLAHEVKNPLTAMNMALRALAGRLGEDEHAVVEDLARRLGRVERIARDALSAASPLVLRRSEFDACELARAVMRDLGRALTDLGAELDLALPAGAVPFVADAELLREVLSDLVRCVLEAAGADSRVLVGVEPCGPASLRVLVEGRGAGPPGGEPHFAAEQRAAKDAGSVASRLAFCKLVVEEHGGGLRVERGSGAVARFVVDLPAHDDP